MVEQRASKRFDIRLPVKLLRNGLRSVYGLGETRNLSSGGVLFVSDTKVDIGEPLEYVINMTEAGGVNLHCLGKVLRIELPLAGSGVPDNMYELAVTLERYEFLRRDF